MESSLSQRLPEKLKLIKRLYESAETPFYLYDPEEVSINLNNFREAFNKAGAPVEPYFAVKSNPYLGLLKTVVGLGGGLDVSSYRELSLALQAGAKKIIYTGPAKKESDFKLILEHPEKITVNLESLRELKLLSKMASERKVTVRCGVRIFSSSQKGWTKFGIPLNDLRNFYEEAVRLPSLRFAGVHFHISFNMNAQKYLKTLEELSGYFNSHFSGDERQGFEYIDMGGGYYPDTLEGEYSWNPKGVMEPMGEQAPIEDILKDRLDPRYTRLQTDPIEKFAEPIAQVYQNTVLAALPNVQLYAEPGRYISHSSLHLMLRLIDLKDDQRGTVDGGNNMIGWEKYQYFEYAPLYNLSRLSLTREIPFITYGPLCTPDDLWGYYMYTEDQPREGDLLCMPYQGAYTFTLSQEFIKGVPLIIDLPAK